MEKEKIDMISTMMIQIHRNNFDKWFDYLCIEWKKNNEVSTALRTKVEPLFVLPRLNDISGARNPAYPDGMEGDHMWKTDYAEVAKRKTYYIEHAKPSCMCDILK